MIRTISIHNYRFIQDITIPFDKGIHCIIGESGSGKSMLLSAFQYLLQSKDDNQIIGRFDDKTSITVGLTMEDTAHQLVKTTTSDGMTTTLDGSTIPLSRFIALLSPYLTIIAQNGYLYQLQGDALLHYLDKSEQCKNLSDQYTPLYQNYTKLKRQLKKIQTKIHDPDKLDELIGAIHEIHNAPYGSDLAENDAKRIEKDYESLQEKSRLFAKFQQYSAELSALLNSFNTYYSLYEPAIYNQILNATITIQTLLDSIHIENQSMDVDIDALQNDLYKQSQLKRKYHVQTSDQLAALAKEWQDDLIHQQSYSAQKDKMVETIGQCEGSLMRIAHQWNIARSLVLSSLKDRLYPLLKQMGMDGLTIYHRLVDKPFDDNGNIKLIITLEYNGHTMALDQLSGGEKARFAVALFTLQQSDSTMLFAFDEIDSGLSGRSLNALSTVLKDLSQYHTILLLTHHPYMAAISDHLYEMVKTMDADGVTMTLNELKDDAKLDAVAKMGNGETTSSSLAYTKAMIDAYGTHHLSH